MDQSLGCLLALFSGFLAAFSAFCAKSVAQATSAQASGLSFVLGYAVYVAVNIFMWIVFSFALKKNGRCITTLTLNTVANFGFSDINNQMATTFPGSLCLLPPLLIAISPIHH